MTRKQFLVLVLALLVFGGAGLALFWQDIAAYRASGARIGGKLLPQLAVAEVAEVRLQDAKARTTLLRKDDRWVVEERGGYTADFQAIGDFIVKLAELKVTQSEQVGESLLPRVELAEPGKGEGSGTLVEMRDKSGKVLAGLILGKKVLKRDPLNPLPGARDGVPAGRYVKVAGGKDSTVVVVSDPLNAAEARPAKWLAKDFFKADRVKTLAVSLSGAAPDWKITRDVEWGQWKFAGGGELDASSAVSAVNALGRLAFTDVATKPQESEKPAVVVAETFDNLTYTLKLAKKSGGEEYYLNIAVAGEPPKARPAEKGEKPEEKARRDKDFAETLKRLEERVAAERALAKWTYVVDKAAVEPLLKERAQMVARKPEKR